MDQAREIFGISNNFEQGGIARTALAGGTLMVLASVIATLELADYIQALLIYPALAVLLGGLGMAEASLMSAVMSARDTSLGASAALLGALQLSFSAFATPLSGSALDVSTTTWGGLLVLAAIATLGFTWVGLRSNKLSLSTTNAT
ncbi:hypothetical protein [Pseudomonas syringae]|uniref:hypothetical protein n=1 Tax=Pseudomonas syringae TaxID=317 RepID=UPI00200B6C7F|nr:hypothetical protein [Pseudomonas syringae]MCK9744158.1 hypothetical protein [Pseudomonas syringae pv. syringae]MCK9769634.1 hypothetical protein [Pseudomonas syringae pv. syringae]